jgi:microcystin-dependent protein
MAADQGTYTPVNLPYDGEVIDASQVTTDLGGLIDEFNKPVGLSKLDVSSLVAILPPSGSITMFGAAVAPSGWLICDGSAVSRSTYSTLFSTVGTSFGIGDGYSTFNLPNLQDTFPIGSSGTKALGSTGGTATTTHETFSTPTGNAGDLYAPDDTQISAGAGLSRSALESSFGGADNFMFGSTGEHTFYTDTQSNIPTYQAFAFIIKT